MGCGGSKDVNTNAQQKRGGSQARGGTMDDVTQNIEVMDNETMTPSNHDDEDVASLKGKSGSTNGRVSKGGQSGRNTKTGGSDGGGTRPQTQEINEKGYKRRCRESLRKATAGHDLDELEKYIDIFEKNKMEDNGDLYDAKERRQFLLLRKDIRDAILRRHPGVLDKAIDNVETSNYCSDLQSYLDRARELRAHLSELDNYRHDILSMDQSTISEIRSYQHPPPGVHEVMSCTYLILGYEEKKLQDWTDVQCLLGRYGSEGLIRKVREADTVNLDDATTKKVQKVQSQFTEEKIRIVSCGAATFYEWNNNMCNKFSKDNEQQQNQQQQQSANTKGRKINKG